MKKLIILLCNIVLGFAMGLTLVGCKKNDPNEIIIGASATPHAEILQQAVAPLKDKGYTLTIKTIDGYTTMNPSLAHNDLDANYFQHEQFLNDYLSANPNDKLSELVKVHYEPMGIYTAKKDSIDSLSAYDKIMIPNDTTNQQRALQLLAHYNIIQYKGSGDEYLIDSYIGVGDFNISNIDTAAANLVPQATKDNYAVVVINGNEALKFYGNVNTLNSNLIVNEPSELGQKYGNLVAVRTADKDLPKMQALADVLTSEVIKDFIDNTYGGLVLPL